MKFIDISGFGHSGKGIITDLLKEFEGYHVPHYNFEFNLLRIQGGLADLWYALDYNWSPVRSDAAIRRFRKLIKRIGPAASFANPVSLFLSNGMNYDNYFNGAFSSLSNEYIQSLIDYEYDGEWPYPMVERSGLAQIAERIALRSKLKQRSVTTVFVAAPENFISKTRKYLDSLFANVNIGSVKTYVLHNATEPFNPTFSLNFFSDAGAIIVQRDPRDIYASTFVKDGTFNPSYESERHWKLKRSLLNTDRIENFIHRQKLYYDQVNYRADDDRILRIRYEDMIMNYNSSIKKIYDFLDESCTSHVRKFKYFNPEVSAKNIGLWKKMENQNDILKIEQALKPYCYYE